MSTEDVGPRATRKVDGPKTVLFAMVSGFIIGFAWFLGTFIPPCVGDGEVWPGVGRALNVALGYFIVYSPFMFTIYGFFGIAAAAVVGIAVYFRKWPGGWPFGLFVFVVSTAIAVFVGVAQSHGQLCRVDFM